MGRHIPFRFKCLSIVPLVLFLALVVIAQGPPTGVTVVTLTAKPAQPTITLLSPNFAAVGESVTITGSGFATTRGVGTVTFGGIAVTSYTSWSALSIVVVVPSGALTGNVVVTQNGLVSVGSAFSVVEAGGAFTDAAGALWVSTTGIGTGTCIPPAQACTVARALAAITAGGTIIINSGTYSGGLSLSNTTTHDNITITAPAAVKNALTWGCDSSYIVELGQTNCGKVIGNDNRPFFSAGTIDIPSGTEGATVEYIRIQMSATGTNSFDGFCFVADISGLRTTLRNNDISRGCSGIGMKTIKGIRIIYNYIHDMGGADNYPGCISDADHHGLAIYNFGGVAAATGYGSRDIVPTLTSGIVVSNNTIRNLGGDGMQEDAQNTNGAQIQTQFLIQAYNDISGACEQGLDYKGGDRIQIVGNDIYTTTFAGISTNTDDGAFVYAQTDWLVRDNTIHDNIRYGIFSQTGADTRWMIWNNVFFKNCTNTNYNDCASIRPPDASRVEYNTVWDTNRSSPGIQCTGILADRGSSTIVRNNIVYQNCQTTNGNISPFSNGTISNNRCFPTSPGNCGAGSETGAANDFVNITTAPFNFRLSSTSVQSWNAATTVTPNDALHTINIDRLGVARPVGAASDHGAFELP